MIGAKFWSLLSCVGALNGGARWVTEAELATRLASAPEVQSLPTKPSRMDGLAGLPEVSLSGARVPVLLRAREVGGHEAWAFRGQYLMALGDGGVVAVRPLTSPHVFQFDTIFEDARRVRPHADMREMRVGVELAQRLADLEIGPKIFGVFEDERHHPYVVHEPIAFPLRREARWSREDALSLETMLVRIQTEISEETREIFNVEAGRTRLDELVRHLERPDNFTSFPLRFAHDSRGRLRLLGFSYAHWYWQLHGMRGLMVDLTRLTGVHPKTTGPRRDIADEGPDGFATRVRFDALTRLAPEDITLYLAHLHAQRPVAWDGLVTLLKALRSVAPSPQVLDLIQRAGLE